VTPLSSTFQTHKLGPRLAELDPSSTGRTRPTITTSDSLLTQTGAWMGTPKYMAPELGGAAKHARPAADVFAFGVMAYELLTGRAPFEESPAVTRVRGAPFARPPTIKAHAEELEVHIAELLDACLAESPESRPESQALSEALATYAERLASTTKTRASRASIA
jgi:serine/threonine-protein kinase